MKNNGFVLCDLCKKEIYFDQKSVRKEHRWYHKSCLEINYKQPKKSPQVVKAKVISEQVVDKFPSQIRIAVPQMQARSQPDFGKPTKTLPLLEKGTKSTTKVTPDPVLVIISISMFSVLMYAAYSILSTLSMVAIGMAALIALYHILSKKPPHTKYQYKTKSASVYSTAILLMPFVFGTIMAYDGILSVMTIVQAIFIWSLSLSFWQTMLFVPLAVRSVTREQLLPEPKVYPKMSIIIPAYNEEKVIRTTIESLLYTDYPDKEIILVDDGSTDKTLEIALQYKDKIKVVHKENGGKASALNLGLLYATSQIITVIDADTIIGPSSLKSIAKSIMQQNVAAVAGNIKIRNKVNWLTWCQALEYLSGIQIMRRGLDYFGAITIVPGALGAFKKEKLLEAGTYHKETLVEDFDATIKVLRSGMVVSASNSATAYTQAPQTIRDFYKQRKRWYRGNLQVLRRHSDILVNPRFGYLQRLAYPLMAIHMLVIPAASVLLVGFVIYQLIVGSYYFVGFTLGMFILLQFLLSAMAIRMDHDDKKMLLYSVFFVIGYKQLIDILQLKAVFEELLGAKAKWTSASRVRQ